MPAKIDALPVTRLFPEIAKNPAELFVKENSLGMTAPDASYAVNTPTTVPAGALLFTVKLLILIVIRLSSGNGGRLIDIDPRRFQLRIVNTTHWREYNMIKRYCQYHNCSIEVLDASPDATRTRH